MAAKHFLDKVADEAMLSNSAETLVILPTRRAAADLRSILSARHHAPAMLPVIMGVSDFNERSTALPVVGKDILLPELFTVYSKHDPAETFSAFTGWGEQLLKDFNEIDLQLVFANDLFGRMADIREMEMEFSPEDDRENFLKFWKDLSGKNITPLREQFLSYWEKLPFVYHDFRNHLIGKQIAYEGLALRLSAEAPDLPRWLGKFRKVIYAGFYALNRVEEKFLEKLGRTGQLLVMKDADTWYTEDKQREAGMFFRKGYLSDPGFGFVVSELKNEPRSYSFTGVSGATAMAREIAFKLSAQLKDSPDSATRTVIILPDETLLFPFLNFCQTLSIPVNPSMGFPVIQHVLWQVSETLRLIRTTFPVTDDPSVKLRKKELLLSNYFLNQLAGTKDAAADESAWPLLLKNILHSGDADPFTETLLLIDVLYAVMPLLDGFASQAASVFVQETETAAKKLNTYHEILDAETWWKLIMDHLRQLRFPFKADREKGVHVMGFLETRVLDFTHVYIASMNEGTFPDSSASTSLIPYVIRKYYGLPCREEQDAVTAYHFYRLLQRAENVNFYYNENPDAMGGGEKSRFLLQLFHELIPAQKDKARVEYFQVVSPPEKTNLASVKIEKSETVLAALRQRYLHETDAREFSASALNTYITCPLRFYLEQIAGIRSPDDPTTGLEANILGSALHKAMELLYKDLTNLDKEVLESLRLKSDEAVNLAIAEVYRKGPLYGHDLLMKEVLRKLVNQILEHDLSEAPFDIIGLERDYRRRVTLNGHSILLKGFIDRLDFHNGRVRVLDYKTGQDEAKMPKDTSRIFKDPKFKVTFQLLMYLYLVQPEFADKTVHAGIFRLSSERSFTYLSEATEDLLAKTAFEENLSALIGEIFNPDIPFSQTEDIKHCRFCDFSGICQRI